MTKTDIAKEFDYRLVHLLNSILRSGDNVERFINKTTFGQKAIELKLIIKDESG